MRANMGGDWRATLELSLNCLTGFPRILSIVVILSQIGFQKSFCVAIINFSGMWSYVQYLRAF